MNKFISLFIVLFFCSGFASPYLSEIAHLFECPEYNLTLEEYTHEGDLVEGQSADIFFMKDEDEEIVSVVKMLRHTCLVEPREVQTMRAIKRHKFTHFKTPEVLDVKRLEESGATHTLVAMSKAPGQTLNTLVKQIAPLKGDERLIHLKILQEGAFESGKALGELHKKTSRHKNQIASAYRESSSFILDHYLDTIRRFGRRIKLGYFQSKHLVEHLKGLDIVDIPGIIHGDPHIGNILYDSSTRQVTFIDLHNMSPSMRAKRGGPIAYDYVCALLYLEELSYLSGKMSEAEVNSIVDNFKSGYRLQMPNLPPQTIAFYTALFYMDQINCFVDFQTKNAEAKRLADNLVTYAAEKLRLSNVLVF